MYKAASGLQDRNYGEAKGGTGYTLIGIEGIFSGYIKYERKRIKFGFSREPISVVQRCCVATYLLEKDTCKVLYVLVIEIVISNRNSREPIATSAFPFLYKHEFRSIVKRSGDKAVERRDRTSIKEHVSASCQDRISPKKGISYLPNRL